MVTEKKEVRVSHDNLKPLKGKDHHVIDFYEVLNIFRLHAWIQIYMYWTMSEIIELYRSRLRVEKVELFRFN